MFWKNLGMTAEQVKKLPIVTYETITEIMNLDSEHKNKELRKNGKH
jgi:hypothetical protein